MLHKILELSTLKQVDKKKLKELIEGGFNKKLIDNYFDLLSNLKKIFLEEDYKGVAIILDVEGSNYLDKLVVHPDYQGNGLGKRLFKVSLEYSQNKGFFWRASSQNPFNEWYKKQLNGNGEYLQVNDWTVYLVNVPTQKREKLISYAVTKTRTI